MNHNKILNFLLKRNETNFKRSQAGHSIRCRRNSSIFRITKNIMGQTKETMTHKVNKIPYTINHWVIVDIWFIGRHLASHSTKAVGKAFWYTKLKTGAAGIATASKIFVGSGNTESREDHRPHRWSTLQYLWTSQESTVATIIAIKYPMN